MSSRLLQDEEESAKTKLQLQAIGFRSEQFENLYRQMSYWAPEAATPYNEFLEAQALLAEARRQLAFSEGD